MKLNLLQTIGFWWYRNIDINGFIFTGLRSLHTIYRYLFYFFLVFSFKFSYDFLIGMANYYAGEHNFYPELISALLTFFLFISTSIISLIFTYEFIYKLDIRLLVEQQKEKRKEIKRNKNQWWRLRNKNIALRILFYLITAFILVQVTYTFYIDYALDSYNVTYDLEGIKIGFNTVLEQEIFYQNFTKNLYTLMMILSGFYSLVLFILEFLIYKNKRAYNDNKCKS